VSWRMMMKYYVQDIIDINDFIHRYGSALAFATVILSSS